MESEESAVRANPTLRKQIIDYLSRHPDARCSTIGDALETSWSEVTNELRCLVEQKLIVKRRVRSGYPRYSLRAKRRRAIHQPITPDDVQGIYFGSDGGATRRLYNALRKRGPLGQLAALLLRAQKKSARAKAYRGVWRGAGYENKDESLRDICRQLQQKTELIDSWGWGRDQECELEDVLYLDLPTGQVSFHVQTRHSGPDYPGEWDHSHDSEKRILAFAENVLRDVADPDA